MSSTSESFQSISFLLYISEQIFAILMPWIHSCLESNWFDFANWIAGFRIRLHFLVSSFSFSLHRDESLFYVTETTDVPGFLGEWIPRKLTYSTICIYYQTECAVNSDRDIIDLLPLNSISFLPEWRDRGRSIRDVVSTWLTSNLPFVIRSDSSERILSVSNWKSCWTYPVTLVYYRIAISQTFPFIFRL